MAFIPDTSPKPTRFVPDAPPPAQGPTKPQPKEQRVGDIQEGVLGPTELLGSAVLNLPHNAAHALVDLYRKLSFNAEGPNNSLGIPAVTPGAAGQQLAADIPKTLNIGGVSGPTNPPEAEAEAQRIWGNTTTPNPLSENVRSTLADVGERTGEVASDVGNILPAAGAVKTLAGIPGEIEAAAAARAAAKLPFGMRTGAENPVARNVAGASAQPAVAAHNQAIANQELGAQVGVPVGTKITPQSLEDARAAPNSVYERAKAAIPTGPLHPDAAAAVQSVGANDMVVHSPDTQATVDAQKARLLSGPMTGPQVVDTQRALRFNGFKNIGSEDPEQTALGHAQLSFADALQKHMELTLPPNAPVSAEQLAQARVALAQNHTIESALGPNGDVNLQKLAKIHNDNPGMLSGSMKTIAQVASDHPEVTGLPSNAERFNPSGVVKDVASVDLKRPLSYVQPFFGAAARRALTGAESPVTTPVTGLGGEFGPIDRTPQPPPGLTASPPTAGPPAAAGPPGQIPLADVLAHGVEQSPPAGLSLAPTPPPASGVPFARNAAHEAGDLGLADQLAGTAPENNSDLAKVASQGVPEDIVQRSRPQGPRPKVAHSPAFVSNNASGESAASQEAINRGTKNLVEVDPDGNERPILRDVTQADVEPSPRHLIVNKETGEIVKSGGMAPALARGLLNRWKSMQTSLGHSF